MTSNTSRRRYELDWLRVLAILIVFVYHSADFLIWVIGMLRIQHFCLGRDMERFCHPLDDASFFSSSPVRVCFMPSQNPAAGPDSMLINYELMIPVLSHRLV